MTHRTIRLLVILALGLFWAPLAAEVQQATHVYRIGWLSREMGAQHPPSQRGALS